MEGTCSPPTDCSLPNLYHPAFLYVKILLTWNKQHDSTRYSSLALKIPVEKLLSGGGQCAGLWCWGHLSSRSRFAACLALGLQFCDEASMLYTNSDSNIWINNWLAFLFISVVSQILLKWPFALRDQFIDVLFLLTNFLVSRCTLHLWAASSMENSSNTVVKRYASQSRCFNIYFSLAINPLVRNSAEEHQILLWDWFHIKWVSYGLVCEDASGLVTKHSFFPQTGFSRLRWLTGNSHQMKDNIQANLMVFFIWKSDEKNLTNFEGQLWSNCPS